MLTYVVPPSFQSTTTLVFSSTFCSSQLTQTENEPLMSEVAFSTSFEKVTVTTPVR